MTTYKKCRTVAEEIARTATQNDRDDLISAFLNDAIKNTGEPRTAQAWRALEAIVRGLTRQPEMKND